MSFRAHPSSIVEEGARLGEGVVVGPFCHIGANAQLDCGVHLASHVVVAGETFIGARTKIFPFASIGTQSQDLKARNDAGRLKIGADCVIREGVTINSGSSPAAAKRLLATIAPFLQTLMSRMTALSAMALFFQTPSCLAGMCGLAITL